MSRQKAGANLDNHITNTVHEATPSHVSAHSMRGSGNLRTPQPDVLIRIGGRDDVAMELKRASIDEGERTQFLDTEDIEQLCACSDAHTRVYVGLKMTRRELVVQKLKWTDTDTAAAESIVEELPDCFDANLTASGNITVRKPTTDDWPSATKGRDDVAVVCETLDIEYEVDDDGV